MKLSDIYQAYVNEAKGWTGWTQNDVVDDEKYVPETIADKNWLLTVTEKSDDESQMMTGNMERTLLRLSFRAFFLMKGSSSLTVNHVSMLDNIEYAEKHFLGCAALRGEHMHSRACTFQDRGNYKLATYEFTVTASRSLKL